MSKSIDRELHHKIVRYLDGELDEAEANELRREFARNRQARTLMEEYAANDRLATDALRRALQPTPRPARFPVRARASVSTRPKTWVRRVGVAVAAAAAVLITTCSVLHVVGGDDNRGTPGEGTGLSAQISPAALEVIPALRAGALFDGWEPPQLIDAPRRGERILDRRYFGVFDEKEQKLYLLELDSTEMRVQTVGLDL